MYVYYQTYNILSARAFSEERLLICVLLLLYSAILQSWSFSSLALLVWPYSVSLSVCQSVSLLVCLPVCQSASLPVCQSVSESVCHHAMLLAQ